MSWFWGGPEPGDWVTARHTIKTSFVDHVVGGDAGIRPRDEGRPSLRRPAAAR